MEDSGGGYSQHLRRRQGGGGGLESSHHGANHLMKDRDAYIRHLEMQLERVSAACTQSQGFGECLATLQDQHGIVDERISSLTKMIAAINNKSESTGSTVVVENIRLEGRLSNIENSFSERLLGFEQLVANQATDFNAKLKKMEQARRDEVAEYEARLSDSNTEIETLKKQVTDITRQYHEFETVSMEREAEHRRIIHDRVEKIAAKVNELYAKMDTIAEDSDSAASSAASVAARLSVLESGIAAEVGKIRTEMAVADNGCMLSVSKQASSFQEQIGKVHEIIEEAVSGGRLTQAHLSSLHSSHGAYDPRQPSLRTQVYELNKKMLQNDKFLSEFEKEVRPKLARALEAGEKAAQATISLQGAITTVDNRNKEHTERICEEASRHRAVVLEVASSLEDRVDREVRSIPSAEEINKIVEERVKFVEEVISAAELKFVSVKEQTLKLHTSTSHLQTTLGSRLAALELATAKAARDATSANFRANEMTEMLNEVADELKGSTQGILEGYDEKWHTLEEEVSILKSSLEGMIRARVRDPTHQNTHVDMKQTMLLNEPVKDFVSSPQNDESNMVALSLEAAPPARPSDSQEEPPSPPLVESNNHLNEVIPSNDTVQHPGIDDSSSSGGGGVGISDGAGAVNNENNTDAFLSSPASTISPTKQSRTSPNKQPLQSQPVASSTNPIRSSSPARNKSITNITAHEIQALSSAAETTPAEHVQQSGIINEHQQQYQPLGASENAVNKEQSQQTQSEGPSVQVSMTSSQPLRDTTTAKQVQPQPTIQDGHNHDSKAKIVSNSAENRTDPQPQYYPQQHQHQHHDPSIYGYPPPPQPYYYHQHPPAYPPPPQYYHGQPSPSSAHYPQQIAPLRQTPPPHRQPLRTASSSGASSSSSSDSTSDSNIESSTESPTQPGMMDPSYDMSEEYARQRGGYYPMNHQVVPPHAPPPAPYTRSAKPSEMIHQSRRLPQWDDQRSYSDSAWRDAASMSYSDFDMERSGQRSVRWTPTRPYVHIVDSKNRIIRSVREGERKDMDSSYGYTSDSNEEDGPRFEAEEAEEEERRPMQRSSRQKREALLSSSGTKQYRKVFGEKTSGKVSGSSPPQKQKRKTSHKNSVVSLGGVDYAVSIATTPKTTKPKVKRKPLSESKPSTATFGRADRFARTMPV